MEAHDDRRTCACGCGEEIAPDRRYVHGHNTRKGTRPRCSGCGREAGGNFRSYKSYDAETGTFVCNACRDRTVQIVAHCRRCGRERKFWPSAAAVRQSLEHRADGAYTYLCRSCQSRDRLRGARLKLLSVYGVTQADGDDVRLAAMQQHAQAVVKKAGGRQAVLSLANKARAEGLSAGGKRRLSLGLLIAADRSGEFRQCPLCHCLIYLLPVRLRQKARGIHRACYREWQNGKEHQAWIRSLGAVGDPMRPLKMRKTPPPMPKRPKGRPATPEMLGRYFTWVLRHYGLGQSWRAIGEADGYGESGVRGGVATFIRLLPSTWALVFCGRTSGPRLDTTLPVADLRRALGRELGSDISAHPPPRPPAHPPHLTASRRGRHA